MKRTPYYHQMVDAQATWQEAQGWEMPAEFTGTRVEHVAVRERAGVIDWSSTGEIEIQGPDALRLVQRVIVNDASTMPIGRVLYSTICQPNGAILSDITVYRLGENRYWIMSAWSSNRANQFVEFDWIKENSRGLDVSVTDVSSGVALLALQGPCARDILFKLTPADLNNLPYMNFVEASLAGAPPSLFSRTGYTGELGYELVVPTEHAHELWDALMAAGQQFGLALVGLKAAFSLRIEKGYIMRFDFINDVTPLEIGLGWTVKFDKGDFVGRDALLRQKHEGVKRRVMLLEMQDEFLPTMGSPVVKDGNAIGKVTSSAYGYSVGSPLALSLLQANAAQLGAPVSVDEGGQLHPARIARRSIYDPEGTRLKA